MIFSRNRSKTNKQQSKTIAIGQNRFKSVKLDSNQTRAPVKIASYLAWSLGGFRGLLEFFRQKIQKHTKTQNSIEIESFQAEI